MSEILPASQDAALVELVDKWIDGELTAAESAELEQRLLSDPVARDFCSQRMRFHSDLQNSLTPMRVEVEQKKHMVVERRGGMFKVFSRESQVTRIGNPVSGKFVEFPPLLDLQVFKRRILWAAVAGVVLISALLFALFHKQEPATVSVLPPAVLQIRNAGFEKTDLSENENSSSFGILHWQDHFRSSYSRTVDLQRESQQKYSAHSGRNVAMLQRTGFLTQRLERSDGQPVIARSGLRLKVSGWALVPDTDQPQPLLFALRVVKDVQPYMRQYEPCLAEKMLIARTWQPFSVELSVPHGSLLLKPAWVDQVKDEDNVKDITGEPLTLSIDNRSGTVIYLDDLTIEQLDDEEK